MHPLAETIQARFPDGFVSAQEWRGDLAVTVKREALHAIGRFLKDDPAMACDYMVLVSSVDWPDEEERFEVVYEVYSIRHRHRIRVKTRVPEHDCYVDSLTDIWAGRGFHGTGSVRHDGHPVQQPPGHAADLDARRFSRRLPASQGFPAARKRLARYV